MSARPLIAEMTQNGYCEKCKVAYKSKPERERERYKLRTSGEAEKFEIDFAPYFAFCASYDDIQCVC